MLPLSPVGTMDCQVGGEAGGGSGVQHSFCCVNTYLVSPCTSRHVYVGGEPNPTSAPLVLSARSSSLLPAGVSQDPPHLGHWSRGAHGGFAGDRQGFAARRGAQGHPPLLEEGTGVLPFPGAWFSEGLWISWCSCLQEGGSRSQQRLLWLDSKRHLGVLHTWILPFTPTSVPTPAPGWLWTPDLP